jgi:hypothetical protein
MKLSTEKVLERAEEICREQGGRIESRQIRALAQALVEEVNKMFVRVELTRTVKAIGGFESRVKNRDGCEVPEVTCIADARRMFTQDISPNKIVH